MSVIHADGFALYGTGATSRTNMLLGVWAEVTAGVVSCETTNPRGDGTHHLRIANVSGGRARRVLGGDHAAGIGFAAAFFPSQLPTLTNAVVLFQARDETNVPQWSVMLETDGRITVRTGAANGTQIADSVTPCITAGAYQHLELFGVTHISAGEIEVRVDGQTVINATGLAMRPGSTQMTQWIFGNVTINATTVLDVADVCTWDTAGAVNNDFLGDVQWLPWFPTSDEAASDWTRNTGSNDFECIDDTTPDGDTTYVEATSVGNISEYGLTNVPGNTSDIIAVITQPMARKTDAGAGAFQTSLLSTGSPGSSEGADTPLTEVYTYYPEVHETDPATGVRFTPSGWNAARLRIERTA